MATGKQPTAAKGWNDVRWNGGPVYERPLPLNGNGRANGTSDHTVVQLEPPAQKESTPMTPITPEPTQTQQPGLKARKWLLVKIGFSCLAAIFVAVAIFISVTNGRKNAVKRSTEGGGIVRYDSANPPAGLNGVELSIKMVGFDPTAGLLKLNINLNPAPLLASPNFEGQSLGINRTVTVNVNDKAVTFVGSNNALLTPSQDISVGLLESSLRTDNSNVVKDRDDPVNYPIDRYDKAIVISASITDTSANRSSAPFIINAYLFGIVSGISIHSSIPGNSNIITKYVNTAWFDISITRTHNVIAFSIFVGALMWIVSLSLASICISLWFLSSKPEPPVLAASTALLFALPAFRNIQPGAPPVGASCDLASFYWAIAIAALCGKARSIVTLRLISHFSFPCSIFDAPALFQELQGRYSDYSEEG
ncbi:hypothetical protein BJ742DRAFT_797727 [Cladochytrium replicatum]|nr:hypothetical protein BJ742DRAFT_797727 [Cladochytrium replicatum]